MSEVLNLAKELILRASITPDDGASLGVRRTVAPAWEPAAP